MPSVFFSFKKEGVRRKGTNLTLAGDNRKRARILNPEVIKRRKRRKKLSCRDLPKIGEFLPIFIVKH